MSSRYCNHHSLGINFHTRQSRGEVPFISFGVISCTVIVVDNVKSWTGKRICLCSVNFMVSVHNESSVEMLITYQVKSKYCRCLIMSV
jgi:hypothetical protein